MLLNAQQGVNKKGTDPYDGHSISLGGNVAFGGGFNFSIGVVWNNTGDWRFFGSGGPSFGIDASVGLAIKGITNANSTKPFVPNQYAAWGSSHNIAVGPIDVVLIGGDNYPNFSTGTMGALTSKAEAVYHMACHLATRIKRHTHSFHLNGLKTSKINYE